MPGSRRGVADGQASQSLSDWAQNRQIFRSEGYITHRKAKLLTTHLVLRLDWREHASFDHSNLILQDSQQKGQTQRVWIERGTCIHSIRSEEIHEAWPWLPAGRLQQSNWPRNCELGLSNPENGEWMVNGIQLSIPWCQHLFIIPWYQHLFILPNITTEAPLLGLQRSSLAVVVTQRFRQQSYKVLNGRIQQLSSDSWTRFFCSRVSSFAGTAISVRFLYTSRWDPVARSTSPNFGLVSGLWIPSKPFKTQQNQQLLSQHVPTFQSVFQGSTVNIICRKELKVWSFQPLLRLGTVPPIKPVHSPHSHPTLSTPGSNETTKSQTTRVSQNQPVVWASG